MKTHTQFYFKKLNFKPSPKIKQAIQEWGMCVLDSLSILSLKIEGKINIPDLKIQDVYCDFSFTL